MLDRSRIWRVILALAVPDLCASHESTDATLWMQTSAEYRVLVGQVFQQAQWRLPDALAAPPGFGAVENQADMTARKPAVVLDIDETVLDNSPWEALAIVRGQHQFDRSSWNDWVMSHKADDLPGARDYVIAARGLGVEVFYISNRRCSSPDHCPQQDATIKNLVELGFPDVDDARVLMRNEHLGWTSEKSIRRAEIAKDFRISQIIGDDLGDFVPGARGADPQARLDMVTRHRKRFGHAWFLLPNPRYGSWKKALGRSPVSHLQPDRELLCLGPYIPIGHIRGPGQSSHCVGLAVTTRGVVTLISTGEGGLGGYFIQDPQGDKNPETDDSIFVVDPFNNSDVDTDQYIEIRGRVVERNGLTALEPVSPGAVSVLGQGHHPSSPADPIH